MVLCLFYFWGHASARAWLFFLISITTSLWSTAWHSLETGALEKNFVCTRSTRSGPQKDRGDPSPAEAASPSLWRRQTRLPFGRAEQAVCRSSRPESCLQSPQCQTGPSARPAHSPPLSRLALPLKTVGEPWKFPSLLQTAPSLSPALGDPPGHPGLSTRAQKRLWRKDKSRDQPPCWKGLRFLLNLQPEQILAEAAT